MNVRRGWRGAQLRAFSGYVVAALALAITVVVLGEEFGRRLHEVEAWLEAAGPQALAISVGSYALLNALFVPDTLLGIIAGVTFGMGRGLGVAFAGSLLGAAIQYALARRVLKPVIDRLVSARPALSAIRAAVLQQQLRLQFLVRLTPLNRALVNYALGAAGVRFPAYLLACTGFLPHVCLEVYFGFAGKHVAIAASGATPARTVDVAMLVIGLVLVFVVLAQISRIARGAVDTAAAEAAATGSSGMPGG